MIKSIKKALFTSLLITCSFYLKAQSVTKVKIEQLPASTQLELKKKYRQYKVNSIKKVEDHQMKITYQVETQKKNTVLTLVYNENGRLINRTKNKSFTFEDTEPTRKNQPSHDGHKHTH